MAQNTMKFEKKVCIEIQEPTVLAVMSMHMGRSLLLQFGFSLMRAWVNIWAKIQTKHLGWTSIHTSTMVKTSKSIEIASKY